MPLLPTFRACVLIVLCGLGVSVWALDSDAKRLAIEGLFKGGKTDQAVAQVEQAVKDAPDDAAMRFLHGVMLGKLRRDAEAQRVFERMTEDFPSLPEPYNNLAVLHAGQGRLDKSRELLETALRNDPNYRAAQHNLGDIHARLALRFYEAAAGGERGDAALQGKLKMARELTGAVAKP